MRGILICFLIFERESAEEWSGTATRMISQPASSSVFIWATVAATSSVLVVVIDWTETGAVPPILTPPTLISLVFFLGRIILKGARGGPPKRPGLCGGPPS